MKNNYKTNIAIIGGGIIGLFIAEEFLKQGVNDITILEKNPKILRETSSHNSGLIHGGFDATPGTMKAKFNVEGRHIFEKEYLKPGAPFDFAKVNSIILAFNNDDVNELDKLYDQGIKNGLNPEEMKIISKEEVLKLEPLVNPDVLKAFICNSSTVLDPVGLGNYLFETNTKNGLKTILNFKVSKITNEKESILLEAENGDEIEANFVLNVSGIWAENVAKLVEEEPDFKIQTRRGQYRFLDATQAAKLQGNVYFLTPSKHGKGVIVAKLFNGQVMVGPTAEDGVPLDDAQLVTPRALKHVKKIGLKIIPTLNMDRTEQTWAGCRSINTVTRDYHIEMSNTMPHFMHVAGMQSPALSGGPAIAKYVYKKYLTNMS